MFQLLYADARGRMFDHPQLLAGGRTGNLYTEMSTDEAIPLPEGASLVLVPGGVPVGIDCRGAFTAFSERRGSPAYAVGALLPQGFTRTLLPAYTRAEKTPLPLFGYAAVGWKDDRVYVAALATDENHKWNPVHYSTPELKALVQDAVKTHSGNRIIGQLSKCALEYSCFTAQNIFYRRWEGGIPVSPACNARCLGCISLQSAECCPSPQSRINFKPTVEEIVEVAVPHLTTGTDAIVSFGQGCEGEPSLATDTVAAAIRQIRRETGAGTINMNTNAGFTKGIEAISQAGIDSLRVSTISARESTYNAYYRPKDYSWADVCSSISFAREKGVFVSMNLLTFPGLTDRVEELEALIRFIKEYDINMVQIRNLNIDPDYLAARVPLAEQDMLGINGLIASLRTQVPGLELGNYTRPVP